METLGLASHRSRLLQRFFRSGVRSAVSLDENRVIVSVGRGIYEIDLRNNRISDGYLCRKGVRPLKFTHVSGIEGFRDAVYFGEYCRNIDKEEVRIYRRVAEDSWEMVYAFPKGRINHIHAIIQDPYRKCLWVMTGDDNDASGILKVTDDFRNVVCVRSGQQKYRACVGFALPEGLLYASDSPTIDNGIYLMNLETYDVTCLKSIHGSCIYGCKWKDMYVFSTTVEGDGKEKNLIQSFFNTKRGPAIKDDYVHMYSGGLDTGFEEVYIEKKDRYPFILQFGAFHFPAGDNDGDVLYFHPVATVANEYSLMTLEY